MGAPDAQGVYQYDGTELGAPGAAFQNLGQAAQSAQFAAVRAQIAALQLLTDSDWVNITSFGAGWATGAYTARVRKVGSRVDLVGGITAAAGAAATPLLTVPVGFRPLANTWLPYVRSSNAGFAGQLLARTTGVIELPAGYFAGAPAAGNFLPLVGSWYVT